MNEYLTYLADMMACVSMKSPSHSGHELIGAKRKFLFILYCLIARGRIQCTHVISLQITIKNNVVELLLVGIEPSAYSFLTTMK